MKQRLEPFTGALGPRELHILEKIMRKQVRNIYQAF